MDASPPRFGAGATARDVLAGRDLSGQRIIVTGATSGIGVETAAALSGAGAEVIIGVRDETAGARLAQRLNVECGREAVRAIRLDLASIRGVAAFAAVVLEAGEPVHTLINNAGIMACPFELTVDGFESQFGVNHLGHFLLTVMLAPALEAAAQESGMAARVVSLSSIGHRRSPIVWDDIHFAKRDYDKWAAYGQAKTANALFAVALTQAFASHGVFANAVMPGGIMTGLQKHLPKAEMVGYGWIDEDGRPNQRMKTPEQGAATSVWAAVAQELEGVGGCYLEDCALAQPWTEDKPWSGYLPYAVDPEAAARLWALSEEMVGFRAA